MRVGRARAASTALAGVLGLLAVAACSDTDDVPTAETSDTPRATATTSQPSPSATSSESSASTTPPLPTGSPDPDTLTAAPAARPEQIETEDLATGLAAPWGIGFLPDGTTVVTERDSGRVLVAPAGGATLDLQEVGVIDDTAAEGEAGLLGLAVSPTFRRDRLLYFYVTTAEDNRVVRATYDESGGLGEQEVVFDGIPKGFIHDGGRLVFGPDGFLYVSTGEIGEQDLAQDRDSLGGKILRITTEGDPAPGNPFPDSPIWSLGHRNVQGLAFDDAGRLWASEFGDSTFDELNLIVAGGNYGWPNVEGPDPNGEFIDPYAVWSTDEASPSGLAYADGDLYLASLRGERLWRIPVVGGDDPSTVPTIKAPVDALPGKFGRLRTVTLAPDGRLWLTTSNTDGRGEPAEGDDRILALDLG